MSKLTYSKQKNDQCLVLSLSGQIDESFPQELMGLSESDFIQINLEGVKMINSLGIREWIKFITQLKASRIELVKCPKIFIDQVNMVQGFITPSCKVVSFYVPYFNEDESVEKSVLFSEGVDFGQDYLNIKPQIEAEDGMILEIDVIEQKYFKFLKENK